MSWRDIQTGEEEARDRKPGRNVTGDPYGKSGPQRNSSQWPRRVADRGQKHRPQNTSLESFQAPDCRVASEGRRLYPERGDCGESLLRFSGREGRDWHDVLHTQKMRTIPYCGEARASYSDLCFHLPNT